MHASMHMNTYAHIYTNTIIHMHAYIYGYRHKKACVNIYMSCTTFVIQPNNTIQLVGVLRDSELINIIQRYTGGEKNVEPCLH